MAQPALFSHQSLAVTVCLNNFHMDVCRALASMACLTLLLRNLPAVAGERTCEPNCPDPFPPGHKNIGNAWWAIGDQISGVYITNLVTTLVVPRKPDGVTGLRLINSAFDNSVSFGLLRLLHRVVFSLRLVIWKVSMILALLTVTQNVWDYSDYNVAQDESQIVIVAFPDPPFGGWAMPPRYQGVLLIWTRQLLRHGRSVVLF